MLSVILIFEEHDAQTSSSCHSSDAFILPLGTPGIPSNYLLSSTLPVHFLVKSCEEKDGEREREDVWMMSTSPIHYTPLLPHSDCHVYRGEGTREIDFECSLWPPLFLFLFPLALSFSAISEPFPLVLAGRAMEIGQTLTLGIKDSFRF